MGKSQIISEHFLARCFDKVKACTIAKLTVVLSKDKCVDAPKSKDV